mgnify:FL=1
MKKFLLSCFVAFGIGANAQISLGTGTTTGSYPIATNWGYNYTQQIWSKSEIKADAAGNITGLQFYLPSTLDISLSKDWVVYLGHTTKTAFAGATTADWLPVSATPELEKVTQVFAGAVSNVSGVVTITFDTPFAYDNINNLVVAVDENTASFGSLGFYTYTGVTNSSIYYRNDSTNPNPAAGPTQAPGGRAATKSRITFLGLTSSAPVCPTVSAPAAGATGVSTTPTITWAAATNATGYRLSVGTTAGGTDVLNAVDLGNTLTYTFTTPLSSNTKYFYTVNSYSATIASSGCAERSFTTACGTTGVPYSQNFESVTPPAIPACTAVQTVTGNPWTTVASPTDSSGFSTGNVLRYSYSTTANANAWFYTQGLNLTGGVSYVVRVRVGNNGYEEKLKIGYGTTAVNTAMTTIPGADYTLEAGSASSSVKSAVFTPATSGTYYIGFNANSLADQYYLYIDDISIDLAPTVLPDCITATTPANGATGESVRPTFSWGNANNALGYKLYLGTTTGNYDLINGVESSSPVTYINNPALIANTTYYLKIVPNNNIGDATGCTETTFTTGSNPYAPYCGPFTSSTPTQITPITSFTLNGVTNNTDTTATTFGSFATNESFTGTAIEVKNNITTIPFSVTGIGIANNGWGAAVFIDWNEDGDFLDAGESYFNTTATMLRTTTVTNGKATLSGNLAIPTGAPLGQKRLRVKYNFTGTTINSPLTTACTDLTNGQVEDYTINYKSFLAVSDLNKADISVYPNPFKDILKISDVKGVKSITVNDMSGRAVKSLEPAAEINLSNLKEGLYIVNLKMEDGSVKTFKAIKK